jgi:2-iminoacetate synthase ThiH
MTDQELIDFYSNYRTKAIANLKNNFSYTLFIVLSKICNLNCSNCQTICLE